MVRPAVRHSICFVRDASAEELSSLRSSLRERAGSRCTIFVLSSAEYTQTLGVINFDRVKGISDRRARTLLAERYAAVAA